MTNEIGTGTVNFPVNMPRDERLFWGRLAGTDRSVADVHREMTLRGLEVVDLARAAELREIRQRYYGAALLVLFCASLTLSILSHGEQDFRRASRRTQAPRAPRGRTANPFRLVRRNVGEPAEIEVTA